MSAKIKISIREIAAEDAAEIVLLSYQLGYVISEKQTLQNIKALTQDKHHLVFVAVDEKKVIGWMGMSYSISLTSLPLYEIHGLVVDEQCRAKGIGRMMIEKAKQWCKSKGATTIRLRCNIKRAGAILFYHNVGFTEVKQQKVFEMQV
ncbi:MAG: GNAT family N-acetyltransferase [Ginsengibacter sp.]